MGQDRPMITARTISRCKRARRKCVSLCLTVILLVIKYISNELVIGALNKTLSSESDGTRFRAKVEAKETSTVVQHL